MQEQNAVEHGTGSVNFDNNNLISAAESRAAAVIEATPTSEPPTLGNIRGLGVIEQVIPEVVPVPKITAHTISVSIDITLNTGLTFLQGRKNLKSVEIENPREKGVYDKWNLYNPFLHANADRHTGEGLLRRTFAKIAKIADSVVGRDAVYLGDEGTINSTIVALVENIQRKLIAQFPTPPTSGVFEIEIELEDSVATRPVEFCELFDIFSWVVVGEEDDDCLVTHDIHFNLMLNVGALYDSKEPHAFVRRALSFMSAQMAAVGLADRVDYHVNYAIDSTTLVSSEVRDTLEILIAEDGFSVVSRAGVSASSYDWISAQSDHCLFGYGCDLILRSPDKAVEEV